MPSRSYRYFDAATRGVDFAGMMADLAGLKPGDVLLLHGCCHNPTGANLSLDAVARAHRLRARQRGAVPMIDLAYQGFGDGLEADVAGLRHMAARGARDAARRELLEELRPLPRPRRRRLRARARRPERADVTQGEPRARSTG